MHSLLDRRILAVDRETVKKWINIQEKTKYYLKNVKEIFTNIRKKRTNKFFVRAQTSKEPNNKYIILFVNININ